MTVGAYPGSFNPPTVAHLAIARAAVLQAGLSRVDLVVSESALGKAPVEIPTLDDRLAVLADVAASRPWLAVRRTPQRLLADIAEGYDALVVGADKWAQLLDPAWYGSGAERDRCLARLPTVLVVNRPPHPVPAADASAPTLDVKVLDVAPEYTAMSSTGARADRREWMADEAAAWDARTGGWSAPERYRPRG